MPLRHAPGDQAVLDRVQCERVDNTVHPATGRAVSGLGPRVRQTLPPRHAALSPSEVEAENPGNQNIESRRCGEAQGENKLCLEQIKGYMLLATTAHIRNKK